MTRVVLSCEHASPAVPAELRDRFRGAEDVLRTHRASDIGSLETARDLQTALGAPLFASRFTRLVADPNRSLHHPRLFSEWTRGLPRAERDALLELDWRPHRAAVMSAVDSALAAEPPRPVLHVSVHSFTPVLDGRARAIDVALLYDPARELEVAFADRWLGALAEHRPDLRLRRNEPYRGTADGMTTTLRGRHPAAPYLGIELEVSQRFPLGPAEPWRALRADLCRSLLESLE